MILRLLDQYRGVLILTTDPWKLAIDDAIINRLHLEIPYQHLSGEQKSALFQAFLDRVER